MKHISLFAAAALVAAALPAVTAQPTRLMLPSYWIPAGPATGDATLSSVTIENTARVYFPIRNRTVTFFSVSSIAGD